MGNWKGGQCGFQGTGPTWETMGDPGPGHHTRCPVPWVSIPLRIATEEWRCHIVRAMGCRPAHVVSVYFHLSGAWRSGLQEAHPTGPASEIIPGSLTESSVPEPSSSVLVKKLMERCSWACPHCCSHCLSFISYKEAEPVQRKAGRDEPDRNETLHNSTFAGISLDHPHFCFSEATCPSYPPQEQGPPGLGLQHALFRGMKNSYIHKEALEACLKLRESTRTSRTEGDSLTINHFNLPRVQSGAWTRGNCLSLSHSGTQIEIEMQAILRPSPRCDYVTCMVVISAPGTLPSLR